MVDVGNVVAWLQLIKVFQRDGLLGREVVAQVEAVVTLKDLVVGVATHLQVFVDEATVDGDGFDLEVAMALLVMVDIVQNRLDTRELFTAFGEHDDAVAFLLMLGNVVDEQVEVFAEDRLRLGVEVDN